MYPEEYINYLIHFHGDRDYFECHEVLEEYWKRIDPTDKQSIWVGFILLAVANYHHRRGNFRGAERTLNKSIYILEDNFHLIAGLGLDAEKLLKDLKSRLKDISLHTNYSSYYFPMIDLSLISRCKETCEKKGLPWGENSDLNKVEIVHRHSHRDRTAVIQERLEALKKSSE